MVLFKRKPIALYDPPTDIPPNAEVWVMRGSNEVFTSYDKYLERYDYFSQRHFTDAVNGKTGMTFFDAIESETASTSDIERIFPEALRAPILRSVQFSEIARMDDLVNHVFEEFVHDFFPGEEVTVTLEDGAKVESTIREKANFPELRYPDGTVQRPAFARYFVTIKLSDEEALTDDKHINRGRNIFTKINVRSFLKNCLRKEAWIGAPWLVKDFLAQQHRLPTTVPAHLTQEAVKAQLALLNSPKGKKNGKRGLTVDQMLQQEIDQQIKDESARPDAPKYPMEDLNLEPSTRGSTRPRLQFLAPTNSIMPSESGLTMDSVGSTLEIWNALNVHWDVYGVDSFNYDDFVEALKFNSPNVTCELFDEIHCGVLKTLVDTEGEVLVRLPEMNSEEEYESEADEIQVDSGPVTPQDRPRSRLSQVQTIQATPDDKPRKTHRAAEMLEEREWTDRLKSRDLGEGGWQVIMVGILYQLSLDKIWTSHCEPILEHLAPPGSPATQYTAQHQYEDMDINLRVSALHLIVMLSMTSQTMRKHLDDRNDEMTLVRKQKVETQRTRKEHMKDLQRLELDRAEANPDAFIEEEEESKDTEEHPQTNGNGVDESLSTINGGGSDDDDEDAPRPLRRSNNARKRKRDEETAKKEAERLAHLSAQKQSNDQIKKYRKILRDIEATKKKILDCESSIEGFDERLRAMNATRMKPLGRDRFWNRYWWFERVGLPIDGAREPQTKKARMDAVEGAGYANGRLWVQGPNDLEREGFIEVDAARSKEYSSRHGITVLQRKAAEEGAIGVRTASQWGFYESSDDVDALIGWLDERGVRERELRKELVAWREDIVAQMQVRHGSLHPGEDSDKDNEELDLGGPRTRVSTRKKTYLDTDDVEKHFRVLRWRNTAADTKSGRHCNPEVAAGAGARKVTVKKGVARPSAGGRIVSGSRTAAREAAAAIADGAARERREAAGGSRRGLRSAR